MHNIRMIKFHDEKNKKEIHKLVKIPDFPYRVLKIDGAGWKKNKNKTKTKQNKSIIKCNKPDPYPYEQKH